jgi:hypothetical protein
MKWDDLVKICKSIMYLSLAVFLLAGAGAALSTGLMVFEAKKTVAALPALTQSTIQTEMKETRQLVRDELQSTRQTLVAVERNITTDVKDLGGTLIATVDQRAASLQTDVLAQVDKQLTETNKSVSTLTTAYADIPKIVGARYERDFNPYFDCKINGLCLQGQTSDTMFAVRAASKSTSEAMTSLSTTIPLIAGDFRVASNTFATDFPKITANVNGIAGNINKITTPKWYDRVLGYALNGAILYRQFNPALTPVTVVTQAISAK